MCNNVYKMLFSCKITFQSMSSWYTILTEPTGQVYKLMVPEHAFVTTSIDVSHTTTCALSGSVQMFPCFVVCFMPLMVCVPGLALYGLKLSNCL